MIEIPLTRGYIAIIDDEDADLAQIAWAMTGQIRNPYAARRVRIGSYKDYKTVMMHRVILERILGRPLEAGEQCDHIHRNSLDNRRSELRLATAAQNMQNRGKQKNNTTGYTGVSFNRHKSGYRASICVNGKQVYLGSYRTPEQAYEAYCKAALKYRGEFARIA